MLLCCSLTNAHSQHKATAHISGSGWSLFPAVVSQVILQDWLLAQIHVYVSLPGTSASCSGCRVKEKLSHSPCQLQG